ncbi:MAG: hypothetical protein WBP29_02445 [Candidatus Zixiibacteriota bacterium]
MKTLLRAIIILFALSVTAFAARPGELYKTGDVVEFRIERNGKIIGSQKGTLTEISSVDNDSLLSFAMETKTVIERSGRSYDLDVSCEVGYRPNGLPRNYQYELTLLNAKVTHEGRFTGKEYMGTTTRLGVTQPFNIQLQRWPLLFDNNFALQWEIAVSSIKRNPGDTVNSEVMIPQLNKLFPTNVLVLPFETYNYGGENLRVRVLQLDPLNQTLYIDEFGRLLKAVDKAAGISVIRQVAGEKVEIARLSIWTMITNRLPGYLLLLAMALGWLVAFSWSEIKGPKTWIAFAVAAALYWLSLQVLMPIQNAYFGWAIEPSGGSGNTYITLLGSALIFAIFEIAAIAIPIVALYFIKHFDRVKPAIAIGAAAGAGFGLMQAANLTQFATDGSVLIPADMIQKIGLIGVSTICGALIGLFIASRLPLQYYLIPIGIKALLNWTAVFVQKGSMTFGPHAFISLLLASACVFILIIFRRAFGGAIKPQKQIKTN